MAAKQTKINDDSANLNYETDQELEPEPEPFKPFPPDDSATWVYWTMFDNSNAEIPEEWIWERLRDRRNSLLNDSDFRMVTDAPWDVEHWKKYRQELRDLPKQTKNPKIAKWPTIPGDQ